MKKLDCILLVDDDPTTNFLNEELISELGITEKVQVAWNGQEALDYLNGKGKFEPTHELDFPKPNIIFLDINMPLMDGFVFLEHYAELPLNKKADIVILFLTTSDSQHDRNKVKDKSLVTDFLEKPLRKDVLLKIVNEHLKE